jgi:hypothetical protein
MNPTPRAAAMAIIALVIASCGPRPEDTMLYLCDGALEIRAATRPPVMHACQWPSESPHPWP